MIRIVAKGKLKPDVEVEEYLQLAKELAIETNKEQGCISYVVHQDINDWRMGGRRGNNTTQ